jgi:hypothetical protein
MATMYAAQHEVIAALYGIGESGWLAVSNTVCKRGATGTPGWLAFHLADHPRAHGADNR